jgi:L-cysteine:1D-myo-inositol 2-amino-2-deoxy-alpha-D-glucopyranoside ligase
VQPWSAPDVPAVPGRPVPLRVYDTARASLQSCTPAEVARMYVCGITPYDAAHLGHAATYLAFDLLQRQWRDAGLAVRYVQNVTDVDDPLLERAERDGVDWRELAEQQVELFRQDMAALRVLPPTELVGAVESIPEIAVAITRLRSTGSTYEVGNDTYFSVHSDPRFGEVSSLDEPTMIDLFRERGGDPDRAGKKHPLDALLWQAARPGEPSWATETDLPEGRPGWHVECSVIAVERLGMGFDVQGGGTDLVFPHHEMSAGHAQLLTGQAPFARAYVHAGMVALDGEKMSKSKGNLVFVSRLREQGHDPMAIRLALLAHHYRSDWEWTDADLDGAVARLAAWRAAATGSFGGAQGVVRQVRTALADDLDAPNALAALDRWAAAGAPAEPGAGDLAATAVDALLGVRL